MCLCFVLGIRSRDSSFFSELDDIPLYLSMKENHEKRVEIDNIEKA